MAGRYIKLYEQILDWEWFSDPITFKIFVYILLKANYCDSRFRGIDVKRGQLVTSLNSLATSNHISFQQARTALSHLISTGEITSQAYHEYRVITVVKYDDYQQATSQATSQQQAINKPANKPSTSQATTSKEYIEYKNYRNIEKENSPSESKRKDGDDLFDQFWSAYPRKMSKQVAMKAWRSLKVDETLAEQIMAGLAAWKSSDQWNRDGGQYIPYPASWLRQRRWEDEVRQSAPRQSAMRVIPANDFEQRDYSGINDEIMSDLAAEMEEFLRGGEIDG